MKKAFYDLCRQAEEAARKKETGVAVGHLTDAYVIAQEELRIARMRFEPTTILVYTETLRGAALSCSHSLGFGPQPPLGLGLFGFSAGTRVVHHRSSLDYRLKYAEYPETWLPFMWPRANCSSL